MTDPGHHCGQPYEWVEEPGWQSRVLEWVRECPVCRYSPDRYEPTTEELER